MVENLDNSLICLISESFPAHDSKTILELLSAYGAEPHEREQTRVRTAIVKLSGGKIDRLIELVDAAKRDYRDVLYWLELETPRKG